MSVLVSRSGRNRLKSNCLKGYPYKLVCGISCIGVLFDPTTNLTVKPIHEGDNCLVVISSKEKKESFGLWISVGQLFGGYLFKGKERKLWVNAIKSLFVEYMIEREYFFEQGKKYLVFKIMLRIW